MRLARLLLRHVGGLRRRAAFGRVSAQRTERLAFTMKALARTAELHPARAWGWRGDRLINRQAHKLAIEAVLGGARPDTLRTIAAELEAVAVDVATKEGEPFKPAEVIALPLPMRAAS